MPEVVGKTIDEILPALRRYNVPHKFAEVVRTGQAIEFEQEIFYGVDYISEVWFLFRAFPLQQNCVGVLFDELTLHKQAEESLKRSEARYRAIVEDQTELVDRYLPDGTITFVNEAYCRYFGKKRAEFIGRKFMPFIYPEDQPDVQKYLASLNQAKLSMTEHRVILSSGEIRWQQWIDRPIFDAQGRLVEFQGVGRDITAQKEAAAERERLLAAEREQRLLAETLHEVTLALTAQTSHEAVLDEILRQTKRLTPYTTANIALLEGDTFRTVRSFGYDQWGVEEWVSRLVQSLNELPLAARTVQTRQPVIVADTLQEPSWIKHKETSWIRAYMTIPICHQERVLGMLCLDGDTPNQFSPTDARRLLPLANAAAIALENARLYEQARRDAEAKSILLNEVNHRVKNNLTAIIGLLYAERRHLTEQDRPAYQAVIQDVINHVQGLATVHTLLSASGWKPLLLSNLIDQVIRATIQSLPLNERISVKISPASIQVTSKQANSLALIINELATNTIKYGLPQHGAGQITVNLTLTQTPDSSKPQISVEFRDNGPGLPEKVLHLRQYNVGLYLIQKIVQQDLKGKVTWHNDAGAVTTIYFPVETAENEKPG
jgi:PAS domain S-box-containing protein